MTRPVGIKRVILPRPPASYDQRDQTETRRLVEDAFFGPTDSVAISVADSKAESAALLVGAGGADSVAQSMALSASIRASTADSKAVSDSVVTSAADSKGVSAGTGASVADSKAVSDSIVTSTLQTTSDSKIVSTSTVDSANLSDGNSKNTSQSILISTADSKGLSSGSAASVADSKALSVSLLTSTADSKGVSAGSAASVADSKAVSDSILTSTADSKAVSVSARPGTGFYDVGTNTLSDSQFLLQYKQLRVSGSERYTVAGTGTVVLSDFANVTPLIVGTPRRPSLSFTLPDGYFLDLAGTLTLQNQVRATLQGLSNLMLTDDFNTRSRLVLAGRGF